ncbi:MAG: hypothetical protein ACRDV9_08245 [Acidimicrobiia bacterium]
MTRRRRITLLAASGWTLYVWISRVAILSRQDTSTGFKVVHLALAAVSLGFGIAVGWIGLTSKRAEGSSSDRPRARASARSSG